MIHKFSKPTVINVSTCVKSFGKIPSCGPLNILTGQF